MFSRYNNVQFSEYPFMMEESNLPFLHGTLVVGVEEARDLPNMDSSFFKAIYKDFTDAFAKVKLLPSDVKIAQTKVSYGYFRNT